MISEKRNITIDDVDLLCFGGSFPTARQPHTGIFSGCIGTLANITYINEAVTVRNIEDLILEEYKFRDISLTWQEFAHEVKIIWNRYFMVLAENLKNAADFTLDDETEKVTEKINATQSGSDSSNSTGKYSDTPNQYLAARDGFNGLTSLSETAAAGSSEATGESTRTLDTQKGHNKFERWLELSYKNRNIIFDFVDRFEHLFQTTYIINRR